MLLFIISVVLTFTAINSEHCICFDHGGFDICSGYFDTCSYLPSNDQGYHVLAIFNDTYARRRFGMCSPGGDMVLSPKGFQPYFRHDCRPAPKISQCKLDIEARHSDCEAKFVKDIPVKTVTEVYDTKSYIDVRSVCSDDCSSRIKGVVLYDHVTKKYRCITHELGATNNWLPLRVKPYMYELVTSYYAYHGLSVMFPYNKLGYIHVTPTPHVTTTSASNILQTDNWYWCSNIGADAEFKWYGVRNVYTTKPRFTANIDDCDKT